MDGLDKNVRRARESCARSAFSNALAVRRQVERLREFDGHDAFEHARREADAQFLLLALWRLRLAAEMCVELSENGARVVQALHSFDSAFPGLKTMRHVLMHFDSYLLENEHRRNSTLDQDVLVDRRAVESLFNSSDGISWLGGEYWFDRVLEDSKALYRAVSDELGTSGMS